MRCVLLVSAAALAAIPAAPAAAQHWSDPGTIAAANVTVHRGGPGPDSRRFDRGDSHWRDGPQDRRRHGRFGGSVWLNQHVDYRDRTFEHDSYNDWWHERPHRAYPRWVADNRNCDRRWWSGGVWRC